MHTHDSTAVHRVDTKAETTDPEQQAAQLADGVARRSRAPWLYTPACGVALLIVGGIVGVLAVVHVVAIVARMAGAAGVA